MMKVVKGDSIMKKVLLLIAIFLTGVLAGLLLPAERRGQFSRPLAARIRGMVEHMPDG